MTRQALLALDTSTDYCSVALLTFEAAGSATHQLLVRHELTGIRSSARLLPAARELFDAAGLPPTACVAIGFGVGPGSFTGLRTATGVAQGLAFALGIPVVPVGTLLACAEAARHDALTDGAAGLPSQYVLSVLDARMDEVYWAEFAWQDATASWQVVGAPAVCAPEAVPAPSGPFVLVGNALAVYGERLAAARHAMAQWPSAPHAGAIARLALPIWLAGGGLPPALAAPLYIRDKVALTTAERAARQLAASAVGDAPAGAGVQ
ncbi:MAG: tRNA (adenosine(37)-N6)-threonylcarbamoyltransferase complex dimerization subunit type 1 TsaB [Janthinobacterium lividum]